jgi:flagellar biosynthesis protein FlhB
VSEADDQEKSHEPSERKREQFREKGDIARSKELVAAAALLGSFGALALVPTLIEEVGGVLRRSWGDHSAELGLAEAGVLWRQTVVDVALVSMPPLLVVGLVTLVAAVAQNRFILPKDALEPKLERLDPIANFRQRFLSAAPFVELAKGCVVLAVALGMVWNDRESWQQLVFAALGGGAAGMVDLLVEMTHELLLTMTGAAVVVGGIDYAWSWYQLEEKMRMSHQELKDEHKDLDGDPHLRQARKALQRKILAAANLSRVKTADVIVTNPTHYAVALRYRREENAAPVVVARGVDHLALRIKAEGKRHGVAIVENRALARALYARTEAGRMIPDDLYAPVAQVLASVLKRRARRPIP